MDLIVEQITVTAVNYCKWNKFKHDVDRSKWHNINDRHRNVILLSCSLIVSNIIDQTNITPLMAETQQVIVTLLRI